MPIYEYECMKCGEKFEHLRKLADKDDELKCPKCSKMAAKRILSTFATASSSGSCAPSEPIGST